MALHHFAAQICPWFDEKINMELIKPFFFMAPVPAAIASRFGRNPKWA
jgi:hypothetical protein